jgi:dTMP kinase
MPARGKLIVIEGIDGSGKRTQMEMLARTLTSRNIPYGQISFPRYDGFFGKMVGGFLDGEFGALEEIDPHFSALLYAGDRLEAKPQIEDALAAGKVMLADRYIGSNLAHQGARMPKRKRAEFLKWLRQLEYGVYGLPEEDLVIYLRVPATEARRLVGRKSARQYTKRRHDLQEKNLAHLRSAAAVYDELSRQTNWLRIECATANRSLRTPEAIHEEILAAIKRDLPALAARS